MNKHLQSILNSIQQSQHLNADEKNALIKSVKDADKEFVITEFKLDRTEKVKRTTAILLEETIEELEQKRKAVEAQNRELEIETALEKVRTVAMGMRQPDDLLNICEVMFNELKKSGFDELRNAMINIHHDDKAYLLNYDYSDSAGKTVSTFKYNAHPIVDNLIYHAKQSSDHFTEMIYTGKDLDEWRNFRKQNGEADDTRLDSVDALYYYFYSIGTGAVGISLFKAANEKQLNVLKRFRNVFDLAYKRYVDITTAEAQAREAQIEAALEKVRSRSLAVHKSDEFNEVIKVVFERLQELTIPMTSASINVIIEGSKDTEVYICGSGEDGFVVSHFRLIHFNHPISNDRNDAYENGLEFFTRTYTKEEKNSFYEYEFEVSDLKHIPADIKKIVMESECYTISMALAKHSIIVVNDFSGNALSEYEIDIVKRFSRVFEQAYIRFLDLQKAEAQAVEAQIEAALERVRSRTLAMQKSDELAETSAVLFKQLIGLGISPNRLYISIVKDNNGETEFWITDEDGSKVSMAYEDNLNNNFSFKKMFDGWKQQKKSLVIDMKGQELKDYLNYLSSIHVPFKGGLIQERRWQYIAYFNKGFIGMASPDKQPEETVHLLERFAAVFNLTFTRFNDLKIAEAHALQAEQDLIEIKAARKKAEETLTELQSTQKQLIQSEKMASLGELTAGIAHEIQNPLNFVNNFSEVNKEMLEELKAERLKPNAERDEDLQNDLIDDVIANEQKINHHGKRADAIVKGMLQHSRQTRSVKEPTDINASCDEYLRLSYHGLRAKDKSFNADFKTDFDDSIGKINVVPQDIGRVLLNLFNNAFYAVNEKRTAHRSPLTDDYKPTVSVQTRKLNDKIEIRVEDNGNGISSNIIDKIFQPFFTTKPTGQGTGLGLSLVYDIITKEHSGAIKVESKEGEGTAFIITIPII